MANRVIFVCTIVLAVVYFYATEQIHVPDFGDPVGPKTFPYLLEIGFLITAALLLVEILQAKKGREPFKPAVENKKERRHVLAIGAVIVWTIAYVAVFEALGYVLATAIYLFALMAYFNRGKWVANGLTAVLFCIASYLLFNTGLGVYLPKGLLKF